VHAPDADPCLCVDLDGTLIRGDTLAISFRWLARHRPWLLAFAGITLLRGRAAMKAFVARQVVPDPGQLPWRSEVVDFLRAERARGRRVVLVTAAHRRIAETVATHLALFDGVVATDAEANVKAAHKLAAIRKLLGDKEFDYIGDSMADLVVFTAARQSYLVAPSGRLLKRARRVARLARVFGAD
jgi:phosphoserine phosphatase